MLYTGTPTAALTLPITGWQAALIRTDGRFPLLQLQPPTGPSLTQTLLWQSAESQILLGAHRELMGGPSADGPATSVLAYGVMPTAGLPDVTFLWRRLLGRDRRTTAQPQVLDDLVWLAETTGRYDEVRISTGSQTLCRLI